MRRMQDCGCSGDHVRVVVQRIIDAEKRRLFDVPAHVALVLASQMRCERAARAMTVVGMRFNSRQRVFSGFQKYLYEQPAA